MHESVSATTAERQYRRNGQRVLRIFRVVPLQASGGNTNEKKGTSVQIASDRS